MIPFCWAHRFTMVRDEQAAWYACPVDGQVVTDEALDKGDRTPKPWPRRITPGWIWRQP